MPLFTKWKVKHFCKFSPLLWLPPKWVWSSVQHQSCGLLSSVLLVLRWNFPCNSGLFHNCCIWPSLQLCILESDPKQGYHLLPLQTSKDCPYSSWLKCVTNPPPRRKPLDPARRRTPRSVRGRQRPRCPRSSTCSATVSLYTNVITQLGKGKLRTHPEKDSWMKQTMTTPNDHAAKFIPIIIKMVKVTWLDSIHW